MNRLVHNVFARQAQRFGARDSSRLPCGAEYIEVRRAPVATLALPFLLAASFLALTGSLQAADFPPISQQQRDLKQVPFDPGASAVLLYRNAEMRFRDPSRQANSRMLLELRIKILSEEGLSRGDVEIPHSRYLRLGKLEGRTVTPDGQVIPLADDAVFKEQLSRNARAFVTKATFPAVSVGAILDVRAELFWDSFYFLEPWVFAQDMPVMSSRIRYFKPEVLAIKTWARQIGSKEMQIESEQTPLGLQFDVSLDSIPALPQEPYSFPDIDLSSRFMVIPTNVIMSAEPIPLLADWRTVCKLFESEIYKKFRKGGRGDLKKKAKTLAAGSTGNAETAGRLLAFVRDEIATTDSGLGVWLFGERDAGDVLETKSGTVAEKALVLQAMLEALKIESDLLWVADRRFGRIDPEIANPNWFTSMVLAAEIDKARVFLDPSDPGNRLGLLPYYFENTMAINCGMRKPEAEQLPMVRGAHNGRNAVLKLSLDEEGRLAGQGTLNLTGHSAWRWLGFYKDAAAALEGWTESLGKSLDGFDVTELTVEENVASQQVDVRWTMRQRDEAVLGDEASLQPSRPLQREQPFTLPPDRRRTPVQMRFAMQEEITLELSWPAGWKLDLLPASIAKQDDTGGYVLEVDADPAQRKLRYHRRFHRNFYEIVGAEAYSELRNLYEMAFKNDGEELVLVRE